MEKGNGLQNILPTEGFEEKVYYFTNSPRLRAERKSLQMVRKVFFWFNRYGLNYYCKGKRLLIFFSRALVNNEHKCFLEGRLSRLEMSTKLDGTSVHFHIERTKDRV